LDIEGRFELDVLKMDIEGRAEDSAKSSKPNLQSKM